MNLCSPLSLYIYGRVSHGKLDTGDSLTYLNVKAAGPMRWAERTEFTWRHKRSANNVTPPTIGKAQQDFTDVCVCVCVYALMCVCVREREIDN